jgi:hypothetical protein
VNSPLAQTSEVEIKEYVLHHVHRPAQCLEVTEAWKAPDAPPALNGREFFSYCPSGDHGWLIAVQADSPEAALALLPALLRPTTRVYAGERLNIAIAMED